MATPAQRLEAWFQHIGDLFAAPLRGWFSSWLEWGLELILDKLGEKAAPLLQPTIDRLESETTIPPELKPILDEIKEPTGEIAALLAQSAGGALVSGAISKVIDYLLRAIVMGLSYAPDFIVLDPAQQLALWLRGQITDGELEAAMRKHGLNNENITNLKALLSPRLNPQDAIIAQFRGIIDSVKMNKDLKEQGWRDEDIKALWERYHYYPTPQDLVRWQAREVFEPNMISKYGLDDELGGIKRDAFYKAGMDDEQITNYWRAHWEHASWGQVVEMLHRDLITEENVYDWFRLVEIPPFWRNLLIQTAYTWPTRVDTRRFYALGTIDDTRLREIYRGMGYRGRNLEDYILWTRIYTKFPGLVKQWKAGSITIEAIRSTLLGWGMTATGADELIANEIDTTEPEATTEGKNLTKTEIYKAVKENELTFEEGVELVMLLDYTREQAELLVETHT